MSVRRRLLIVDDEVALARGLSRYFAGRGYEVDVAHSVRHAAQAIESSAVGNEPFVAVLTDLQLPDGDGGEIVRRSRERLPRTPVLVMTGTRSISGSIEAMRLGAVTVVEKPIQLDALESELTRAIDDRAELDDGLGAAREAGLVGPSRTIRGLLELLLLAAPTDSPVLIEGEPGTGKELAARALRRLSRRAHAQMLTVNCAVPETLLAPELLGNATREGKLTQAAGGTLFLDSIEALPATLQAALVQRLDAPEAPDVRLIASTTGALHELVAKGVLGVPFADRFRAVVLRLPPLRDRIEDLPALVTHFLRGRERRFTPEAFSCLERHPWPGNVRELETLVHRLAVLDPTRDVELADLPEKIREGSGAASGSIGSLLGFGLNLNAVVSDLEDRLIREALARSGGNKSEAARALGLNRTTLLEKLRRMSRR